MRMRVHLFPFLSDRHRGCKHKTTEDAAGTTPHDFSEFLDPTATPSMWIGRIILEPVRSAGRPPKLERKSFPRKERNPRSAEKPKKETPGARSLVVLEIDYCATVKLLNKTAGGCGGGCA